jgi:GT2 family glycosyltransferase
MNNTVDIIIPTYNNLEQLHSCMNSMLQYSGLDPKRPFFRIIVVNNGPEGQLTRAISGHELITVIDAKKNAGWEGGLVLGLEQSTAPLVLFANDDIQIVPGNPHWLTGMAALLHKNPDVAAVGPTSNFVMGSQHFGYMLDENKEVGFLIGFCMLIRRDLLNECGGVAQNLPGGDDLDLSIRFKQKGYRMAIDHTSFVFHWGCQTGTRVYPGHWNSRQMMEDTRKVLITRHKFRPYMSIFDNPKTLA